MSTYFVNPDGSIEQDPTELPPEIAELKGTGPRNAITVADLARARQAAGGSARPGGRPPVTLEPVAYPFGGQGPTFMINRYSLNPLIDFARQLPGGLPAADPPRMFSAGDLPIITASGVDPELLRWMPWYLRHAAATTDNPAHIYHLLEDVSGAGALQTRAASDAWERYRSEVVRWLTAPTPPDVMTEAEFTEWAIGIGWQSPTTGA
jgi:hypothetical protein